MSCAPEFAKLWVSRKVQSKFPRGKGKQNIKGQEGRLHAGRY
jgi:hypothetical protein